MSRNLTTTLCYFCPDTSPIPEEDPRLLLPEEAGPYYAAFRYCFFMHATCPKCGALYLAWAGRGHNSAPTARDFYDLSFRHAFNDEPSPADLPIYRVDDSGNRVAAITDEQAAAMPYWGGTADYAREGQSLWRVRRDEARGFSFAGRNLQHRERAYFEEEAILVSTSEPRVFGLNHPEHTPSAMNDGLHRFAFDASPWAGAIRAVKAVRLDALIGKVVPKFIRRGPRGQIVDTDGVEVVTESDSAAVGPAFGDLLAGLRVEILVGDKTHGSMTFVAGTLSSGETKPTSAPKPPSAPTTTSSPKPPSATMQNGIIEFLSNDIVANSRTLLAVRVTYNGVPVPCAFLRVVLLGVATREIA